MVVPKLTDRAEGEAIIERSGLCGPRLGEKATADGGGPMLAGVDVRHPAKLFVP